MKKWIVNVFIAFICSQLSAQTYQPTWESLDKRPVPDWFKQAKFGIFIHWGVYSVPAWSPKGNYSEWYQHHYNTKAFKGAVVDYHNKKYGNDFSYYQFGPLFKAELYNPDEWAQLIEKSGAKYIVLTSKHHDGFALWPSKEASSTWGFPWNAVQVGPQRDLLGDLFKAVRKTSVHAGMYYSLYEWFNPWWLNDRPKYVRDHCWPQMKDLINTYQPEVFWTDGDWDAPDSVWKSKEFLTWVFNESPVKDRIVVNDRWGSGIRFHHGGIYTPEYQPDLDFEDHYFEESRGMGFSYGYNREEDAWDYNSTQVLILHLLDKVSRGGNFLLDIGPDSHGKIPPIMQDRLLEIGKWMSKNGEAIYGSQRWKIPAQWSEGRRDYKPKNDDWKTGGDIALKLTVDPDPGYAIKECFFTYNAATNNLYLFLPKWPTNKTFTIKDLQLSPGTLIELLETFRDIKWRQEGRNIVLDLPDLAPNYFKTDYAYVIKISNAGRFALNPKINISYPRNSRAPIVTIDNRDPGAVIRYSLEGKEPDETSMLYSKPITIERNATINVKAFRNDAIPSSVITSELKIYEWQPALKEKGLKAGLKYTAYEVSPTRITDLLGAKMINEGVADKISFSHAGKKENIGLSYEGYIQVPSDALYTFYLTSDDGSVLWIDDKELINNDGLHGSEEKSGSIALKKGYHKLRLDYFQATGGSDLKLMIGSSEMKKSAVQGNMLFRR